MPAEQPARRARALAASVSVPSLAPANLAKLAAPLGILGFALWLLLFGPQRTHQAPELHRAVVDLSYTGAAPPP